MNKEHKKLQMLVKSVFGTPDGEDLMKLLCEIYVEKPFHHDNIPHIYYHNFVLDLKNLLKEPYSESDEDEDSYINPLDM